MTIRGIVGERLAAQDTVCRLELVHRIPHTSSRMTPAQLGSFSRVRGSRNRWLIE